MVREESGNEMIVSANFIAILFRMKIVSGKKALIYVV